MRLVQGDGVGAAQQPPPPLPASTPALTYCGCGLAGALLVSGARAYSAAQVAARICSGGVAMPRARHCLGSRTRQSAAGASALCPAGEGGSASVRLEQVLAANASSRSLEWCRALRWSKNGFTTPFRSRTTGTCVAQRTATLRSKPLRWRLTWRQSRWHCCWQQAPSSTASTPSQACRSLLAQAR